MWQCFGCVGGERGGECGPLDFELPSLFCFFFFFSFFPKAPPSQKLFIKTNLEIVKVAKSITETEKSRRFMRIRNNST